MGEATNSSRRLVGGGKPSGLSTASPHLSHFYQDDLTNQRNLALSTSSRFSGIHALEPPPPLPQVKHQPTNKFYDTTFSKAFVSH